MTKIQKKIILSHFKKKEINGAMFYSIMGIYITSWDLINLFFMEQYSGCFTYKKDINSNTLSTMIMSHKEVLELKQSFKKTKLFQKIKLMAI